MAQEPSPARRIATVIVGITMLSAGIAASFSISGNVQTGLLVCGGGLVLNVLVLLYGALVVGSRREEE